MFGYFFNESLFRIVIFDSSLKSCFKNKKYKTFQFLAFPFIAYDASYYSNNQYDYQRYNYPDPVDIFRGYYQ